MRIVNTFELNTAAQAALADNDNEGYTYPQRHIYPQQWNFPSALTALGWATINPERAYTELETLAGMRDDNGMLAAFAYEHGVHPALPAPSSWGMLLSADGRRRTGITHPPLAATTLRLIFEKHPLPERARVLLAHFHSQHVWLLTERNYLGSNEPVLIHPWESGRAESPEWDGSLTRIDSNHVTAVSTLIRGGRDAHWQQFQLANDSCFRVLDPGFSAILANACLDLAVTANILGNERIAAESELLAFNVAATLNERTPTGSLLRAYDAVSEQEIDVVGAGTALTILSPSLPVSTVLSLRHLLTDGALASPFGVSSLDISSATYSSSHAWLGAVSPSTTWLCALGLERHGENAAATLLRSRLLAAASTAGLYEHYDAASGQGIGAEQFSPTAALVLWEQAMAQ